MLGPTLMRIPSPLSSFLAALGAFVLALTPVLARGEEEKKDEAPKEEDKKPAESVFPDKNLEKAVRQQVFAKRDNEEPLTAEDVRNISIVHGDGMEIENLEGLQHCVSVAEIRLADNQIRDVSPLKDLKRLQSLDLANNEITDVAPLANVEALQYLNLEHNKVQDVSPLAGLVKLNSLYLTDNRISEVGHLKEMKKLWSLYLDDNLVTDISVVGQLPWLQSLGLRANGLSDIGPLAKIREVRFLDLRDNKITDLGPLIEACERDMEGDTRFAPFLRLYIADNPALDDEKGKAQLAKLSEIGVRVEG